MWRHNKGISMPSVYDLVLKLTQIFFRQISESGKYNALGYKLHVADVSYKSLFLAFKNILADLANALHVAQDLLATIKPETTPQMLY